GVPEAVHGLAHLADRAAVERERRRLDDGLVPVVERAEPEPAIDVETAFRDAEHGDAPPALVRELEERGEHAALARGRPDRVAGDDRDAALHPVREERRS